MSLPSLELPSYEITLPASKKKIKYRPFVVKETKTLLLALEEGNTQNIMHTIGNMINVCTFGVCDLNSMPQVDVEYLFVKIRNKSFGEGMELLVNCNSCGHTNSTFANLDEIEVKYPEKEVSNEIQLTDNCWIIMHHPSMMQTFDVDDDTKSKDVLKLIAECIDTIIIGEQTFDTASFSQEQVSTWVDGLMEPQKNKIVEFFDSVPKMFYRGKFKCAKCGEDNEYTVEGLNDFFD